MVEKGDRNGLNSKGSYVKGECNSEKQEKSNSGINYDISS